MTPVLRWLVAFFAPLLLATPDLRAQPDDPVASLEDTIRRESDFLRRATDVPRAMLGVGMPWDDRLVGPVRAPSPRRAPDGFEPDEPNLDDLREPLPPPTTLPFDPDRVRVLPLGLDRIDHAALLYVLSFYTTEGRTRATRWMHRAGRWRPMIEAIADELGAPRDLIWIAAIESSFTNDARSRVGAVGMWQFMEATGRDQGLRIDRWVDERRDPESATRAALTYLVDRHDRFGTWPLAFAAYNAGSGHVRGELRSVSATDFWVLDRYACLYGDARRYAIRALALAVIAANPEAFGFDALVPDAPLRWDTVDVPGGVRLALLADAAGTDLPTLQDLNPALRLHQTPPDVDTWPLRIPEGRSATFVATFDRLADRWGRDHARAIVRVGESVDMIAERYGVPVRVLRAVNGLARNDAPPYGSELIVPQRERTRDGVPFVVPAPATRRPVILPATEFHYPDRHRIFYTVQPWDTPSEIAAGLGVRTDELCMWNDLDPDAELWSGMVLQAWLRSPPDPTRLVYLDETHIVPLRLDSTEYESHLAAQAQETRARTRTRTWRVRPGDTVNGLARRFGVSPRDLMRWNGLSGDAMIRVGDELIVGR